MSGASNRLIPANTTLLQPITPYYRITDALTAQAQALNTANVGTGARIAVLQGQVATLEQQVATLEQQVATLQAQVGTLQQQMATANTNITALQGQVTTLQGQATVFTAFIASFNYQQLEVSTGSIYLDNRTIYRRSFVISAALNTPLNVFTYAHGVANINYIAAVQAMASVATGQQLPITFVNMASAPNITTGLGCWADTANIYISVGNTPFANYLTLVTLWYTATDR